MPRSAHAPAHIVMLAAALAAAVGVPSAAVGGPGAIPGRTGAAQARGCKVAAIYLPVAHRDAGVAHAPGTPPAWPTPDGPCPGASPSPSPTASRAATATAATPGATAWPTAASATATVALGTPTPATPVATATATATVALRTPTPTGPTAAPTASPSPTPPPTPTATPTPLGGLFGVQAYQGDLEPLWDGTLTGAGISWVRLEAFWRVIEPADAPPAVYDWAALDQMVAGAARGRLTPLVVVYTKPAWAATRSCGPVDKVPWGRYGDFVRDLVERYDGDGRDDAPGLPRVKHWEIGNEPDFDPTRADDEPDYGSCYGDDPAGYGEELRTAYHAAKAADPEAQVVFGAVAYDRFYDRPDLDPPGPFRFDFVREVVAALQQAHGTEPGWPFFDVLGFHNYNDFRDNWDGPDGRDPEIIGKARHLREHQLVAPGRFDLSALPLLASEMGIAAGPSDAFTERNEDYQAAYVGQVMIRSAAAGLRAAIWYTAADRNTGACDRPYDWLAHGLLRTRFVAERVARCDPPPLPRYTARAAFEPRPALTAFRVMGELLSRATYGRRVTAVELGTYDVEAHVFTLADGRAALALFGDSGDRLGRKGVANPAHPVDVGPALLPGWTGRVRVIDHLGYGEVEAGDTVRVTTSFAPKYVVVEP